MYKDRYKDSCRSVTLRENSGCKGLIVRGVVEFESKKWILHVASII